jgi:hypothetical protein
MSRFILLVILTVGLGFVLIALSLPNWVTFIIAVTWGVGSVRVLWPGTGSDD